LEPQGFAIPKKPALEALIEEAQALEAKFDKLAADHPLSVVVRRPTDLSWRPAVGQKIPDNRPDISAGVWFHSDIRSHCQELRVLFVDWLKKPDTYRGFPLCSLVYGSTTSHSQGAFRQLLGEQVRILQIEFAKTLIAEGPSTKSNSRPLANEQSRSRLVIRGVTIPEGLGEALDTARKTHKHTWEQVADATNLDLKTLRKVRKASSSQVIDEQTLAALESYLPDRKFSRP
jgi:hypothetical protein